MLANSHRSTQVMGVCMVLLIYISYLTACHSQCIKHQSSVLVQQQLGRTDMLSLFVYAKLQEKSASVGLTKL